jgi:hypothetical protein
MAEKKLDLDYLKNLRDLGLNPEVEDINGDLVMRLTDAGGVTTELPFVKDKYLYKNQAGYVPGSTFIPESWRGKGVATEAYKAIENMTGLPIFPDNEQTPAGYGLHDSKGYGKEFGLSEPQLESRLTPTEKMQRNARKKVLMDTLEDAASKADKNVKYEDIQWELFPKIREQLPGQEKSNILTVSRNALNETLKNKGSESFGEVLRKNIPKYASKIKSAPIIGPLLGVAAAGYSGDSSAAIPILNEAESLGPEQGSEDYEIENPQRNPAARRAALEKLSR